MGWTELATGIAARSARGHYGPMRANAAIVGPADLGLGGRVPAILEAHLAAAPARFRGVRHRAHWPLLRPLGPGQPRQVEHLLLDDDFRAGFRFLRTYGLSFEAWVHHPY